MEEVKMETVMDERIRIVRYYIVDHSEVSMGDLRKLLHLSTPPVYRVLNTAGIELLSKGYHTANRVHVACKEGLRTSQEIADRVGIGVHRVYQLKKSLGLPMGRRGRKRVFDPYRNMLIEAGLSLEDIGFNEGITREAIRQYIESKGFYDRWKEARKKRIEDDVEFRDKVLPNLVGVIYYSALERSCDNKIAFNNARLFYEKTSVSKIFFEKIYGIFRDYDEAVRDNRNLSLSDFSKKHGVAVMTVKRILNKAGLETMFGVGGAVRVNEEGSDGCEF